MKKYKLFLLIIIILMIVPFIMNLLKKEHKIKYSVDKYIIKEHFYSKKNRQYDFIIKKDKEEYSYTISDNFKKKKKLIQEIKEFKKNNIKCITPIYKKKSQLDIYCLEDNKQVSKYYLRNNNDYKKILKEASKLNIKTTSSSNKKTKYKNLTIYNENIPINYKFIIWDYKGIYIVERTKVKYQKFIDHDLYDNVLSTTNSRYYVLLDNSSVAGIENISYYDLKKDKYKTMKLKEKLSKDSYINGVNNDLIYITDKKSKVEYTLNIKKKKLEKIGFEENGYIKYVNEEKQILNKSDFFMKEQYFSNELTNNKKITKSSEQKKEGNYYIFIEKNKLYRQHINSNRMLLFKLNNITNWNIKENDIILISNDLLYLYNDEIGLRKIIKYNELKYNGKNIVQMWKY